MDLNDLSTRLMERNPAVRGESRLYAASVISGMVNSLESINNLAYLLSLSTEEPGQVAHLVVMLQSQLPILNEIVRSALTAAPIPAPAKNPRV